MAVTARKGSDCAEAAARGANTPPSVISSVYWVPITSVSQCVRELPGKQAKPVCPQMLCKLCISQILEGS